MIIQKAKFLIPSAGNDLTAWSVVACDQFTSQREYWEQLKKIVADKPSTLNIIYPEVYLNDGDKEKRLQDIYKAMDLYQNDGTLEEKEGIILVDRTISDGRHRIGLVATVDLEEYEFSAVNNARVKATEKTVEERLPARIEVRKNASIESSHVMLLMQDGVFLNSLAQKAKQITPLYDFDLNMNGGHLTGYLIDNADEVLQQLEKINTKEGLGISYAVGDGNHSLATAKKCWELIKPTLDEEQKKSHPARFAMVEVVDIYDESLEFEPIHRVVFNAGEEFIKYLCQKCTGKDSIKAVYTGKEYTINVSENSADAIADLQNAMDEYVALNKQCTIDYIHGDEYTLDVAKKHNAVAVLMPTVQKDTLFDYASRRGVLPRKSFSMGNAEDKRYYFETRKIN